MSQYHQGAVTTSGSSSPSPTTRLYQILNENSLEEVNELGLLAILHLIESNDKLDTGVEKVREQALLHNLSAEEMR